MNPASVKEALSLARSVARGVKSLKNTELVLCPPFVYLSTVKSQLAKIMLGAQDCFWEEKGAYTGEVSAAMLKEFGCSHVILGHSERKNYLKETNEEINRKVRTALAQQLIPIICIGEKHKSGSASRGEIERQMKNILMDVPYAAANRIILVYEPEWAISSNTDAQAATPQDCERAIRSMRDILADIYGVEVAESLPILYGGSVTSGNIRGFLKEGTAHGALVGSSSLDAKEFAALAKNAESD